MKIISTTKLTPLQLQKLHECHAGDIIRDIRTLKKLSILGVVKLHDHTGEIVKHVWGMLVRAAYIDEAETFEVEGVGVFRQRFFSGCFCPFLIKAEIDKRGRIKY